MKTFLLSFTSLLLFSCSQSNKTLEDPLAVHIPKAADVIVRTAHFDLLKTQLKNNVSFTHFIEHADFKNTKELYQSLNHISVKGNSILCLREIGKNSMDFILISPLAQSEIKNAKIKSSRSYDNNSITTHALTLNNKEDELLIFTAPIGNTLLSSSSLLMIENALRNPNQNRENKDLLALFKASKENSIYTKLDQNNWLAQNGFSSFPSYRFGAWSALHLNIDTEQLSLNGFNTYTDSLPAILNLFKNTKPIYFNSPEVIPQNTQSTKIYALNNYTDFQVEQLKLLDTSSKNDTIFKDIEEVALTKSNNRFMAFLQFKETENIQDFLQSQDRNPLAYRETYIYQITQSTYLEDSFEPLLDSLQTKYASLLGKTLMIAATKADIQTAITSIQTGATLSKDPFFSQNQAQLATQSNILFYESFQEKTPKNKISDYFIPSDLEKNETYTKSAQWVAGDGFFHEHTKLSKHLLEEESFNLRPLFTLALDSPIAGTLQWVKNHQNQEYEIFLQDTNHVLYLVNNKGKLLWKKQLESPVQGRIHQVDLYKNGRLQLAFTTEKNWMILDRNGKVVPPFNKNFKGQALGPLAVFDYDNNKEYRFVFTQGKKINMYDRSGKIVKGFRFKKSESDIVGIPQHFRIKGKDYLVFRTLKGELLIKNRVGNNRVPLRKNFNFSDNTPMLLDGKFSFTDLDGQLVQISSKGDIQTKNLRINAAHKTTALHNQLVVLEDNVLYSQGKKATLDFGIYSPPNITEVNKETFISITDVQNEKVYLFDKSLEGIANFPIFGSSPASLTDMNNNGELNLLCQQDKQTIVVYGMKIPKK